MEQQRLISHRISPEALDITLQKISERIKRQGDQPHFAVSQQLELLNQLSQFDFGRYLLQNQGINGYWTHYMLTHPWFGRKTGKNNRGESLTALESLKTFVCDGNKNAPGKFYADEFIVGNIYDPDEI